MKTIVRILLALAFAALASAAYAADPFEWKHFGAAPYASSRDEAMRTRESAFQKLGLPAPVVKLLMEATQKPGEKIRLVNGDRLSAMMSKGSIVHRNVTVVFVKPPISGKMEYAVPAEKWQVSWQGKTYTVILPEICNNWSSIAGPPLPPQKKCVELTFNAPVGGHVRWGVGTLAGRSLLADECNAQRQGDGPWVSWYGECDICIPAIGYIRETIGGNARVFQKFLYPVTHTKQTIRFSTEVWANLVYICLEDASGRQSCGVYMRPQDWKGQYRVDIPDGMWVWGTCPT